MEDEIHFLCKCCIFKEPREKMFNEICLKVKNFVSLTDEEKFQIVLRDFENLLIDYLKTSWNIRQSIINRKIYTIFYFLSC